MKRSEMIQKLYATWVGSSESPSKSVEIELKSQLSILLSLVEAEGMKPPEVRKIYTKTYGWVKNSGSCSEPFYEWESENASSD